MGLFDFLKGKKKPTAPPATTTPQQQSERKFYALKVSKLTRLTPDAVSIYFEVPAALQKLFTYKAGQYITLRVQSKNTNKVVLRSYSLSSCPSTDNFYRIGVKRKVGGAVSGQLVDTTQVGDTLEVFPPIGNFTPSINAWRGSEPHHVVLFAGGSGITPLLSIAKTVLNDLPNAQVYMLYANRSNKQIMYAQHLQKLQQQYPERLAVWYLLEESDKSIPALTGRFAIADYANWLQKELPHLQDNTSVDYFICGPTGMMEAVESALKNEVKVNANSVHVEYFDMDKQGTHNAQQETPPQNTARTATQAATNGQTQLTATVEGKTYQVAVPADTTVLQALLDNGIDAPFMCEQGVCSACRAHVSEGSISMKECHALSESEVAEGYILTCQSIATSDKVVLKYE